MFRLRVICSVTALIAIAVFAPVPGRIPAVHAQGYAGQWNAIVIQACSASAAGSNAALCTAVTGATSSRVVTTFQATCDDSGKCTFTETVTFTGNRAGAPRCSPQFSTTPYSGNCALLFSGTAIVGKGASGFPTFLITDETETFFGTNPPATIHNPAAHYPFDTGIPALAGVYTNTSQNLTIFGLLPSGATAPAGITLIAVVTHAAPGTTPPAALAMPLPSSTGQPGTSGAFVVSFFSSAPGRGMVYFGSGPGCSGLVQVATGDLYAGTTAHVVIVTGNDLPGTVGNVGIQPGATYQFQPVTVTAIGQQTDTNGGKCYSVTMPTT